MFGRLSRLAGASSFLSPLTAWVLLATLLAGFGGGWTVRGWQAGAKAGKVEVSHLNEKIVRIEAANKVIGEADKDNRVISARHEAKRGEIAAASAKVKSEIRDAEKQADAAGGADYRVSDEWLRLYNEALRPGSGAGSSPGELAGAPAGAGASGAQVVNPDEWDALWNHAENAARWAQCRSQLNDLIDATSGSETGVVTP